MSARICDHCGGDIEVRNPKGYCDHLFYPDSCGVCKGDLNPTPSEAKDKALRRAREALESIASAANPVKSGAVRHLGDIAKEALTSLDKVLGD